MSKNRTRVSLADVANTDRPEVPATTQAPAPTTTSGGATPAGQGRRRGRGTARASQEQIGLYVHEGTMQDARSAYMADFRMRGQDAPNGLDHWIGEAVRELAGLRPAERAKRLAALPEEPAMIVDPETGQRRDAKRKNGKVRLSEDTAARMDVARAADEEAGLAARGRTTFIVAAMRYGAERTRRLHETRTGDKELPQAPPGRLPRRGRSRI